MRHSSATAQPADTYFCVESLVSRSALRRLLSLSTIVICTLTSTVLPQGIGFTLQTCETEAPLQEDTNSSEEETERLPTTSVRCKSNAARCLRQNDAFGCRQSRGPNAAYKSLKPNHTGHYLANGLRAPLVI
jgi:hypothetical protein